MSARRPIPPAHRQPGPDLLRGLALALILPVNALLILGPAPAGPLDAAAATAIRVFFEGKGYALFAFLFGVGFWMLMARGITTSAYLLRMAVLGAFGLLHGLLLWPGDILLPYALIGSLLLLFRDVPPRYVVVSAAVALAIPPLAALLGPATALGERTLPAGAGQAEVLAHQYVQMTQYGWTILGCMLLGLASGRVGLLVRPDARRLELQSVAGVGIIAGLLLSILSVTSRSFDAVLVPLAGPVLAAGYVGLLAPVASRASGGRIGHALRATGRLPLTNYVAQSLVLAAIAWIGGPSMLGAASVLLLSFGIYLLQMGASGAWVRRFTFGPLEGAWRVLSYRGPSNIGARGRGSRIGRP